ncbi:MAG: hypothetical protein A3G17_01640 [Planctomycetes bacterium RIFCSPLOWO2_12_FULL_50_35]|nr:MAG: hypothetical protein A3I59_06245 [Planctomycetes bacterium RIFCSPLOWO2_02_FULL_50_16]OHC02239.1 MAG: hypothetical protein A3G17_01640 [Planctomycetes bacterium RIFCSPLOWO2_12_FULL_50_35]
MEIYFSRHAKRQMKWRKIAEGEVKNTILYPEKIEDSIKGRRNAFKHIGQKWLKVTFVQENDKIIVVTAIDKNK